MSVVRSLYLAWSWNKMQDALYPTGRKNTRNRLVSESGEQYINVSVVLSLLVLSLFIL